MSLPKIILAPTDFSETADVAIEYAVELGAQLGATVHLLHVITVPSYGIPELGVAHANAIVKTAAIEGQRALDALADRCRSKVNLGPVRIEVGDARDTIDRIATELDADLIVMGTHGRRGLSRFFLGSVAEAVVRSAPCPVLTVRRKKP
jgi:universal stress protein A